jgi:glycosyltransferase involved in cell wall biosynthesis
VSPDTEVLLAMDADTLVFFATDWGYSYGGVNALNIDLCKAVARLVLSSVRVVCLVRTATINQVADAKKAGVDLLLFETNEIEGEHLSIAALGVLEREFVHQQAVWWVGHDLITGMWAQDARDRLGGRGLVLLHHMDYDAYKTFQSDEGHDGWRHIQDQNELFPKADVVLAVGPKLLASARDKLRGYGNTLISELIPGLPKIAPIPYPERFRAITIGRLESRNDVIKQLQLAARSFGAAIGKDSTAFGKDPSITVLGVAELEAHVRHQDLMREIEKQADRLVGVRTVSYQDDHNKILDEVRRHSVLMMLSLHEGFGLAGWEAIAAAVPLIISVNSGVYETIDRLFGGMGTGCVEGVDILGSAEYPYYHDDDLDAVRRALIRIARKPVRAKENAVSLRALIGKFCSWEHTAADFCAALGVETKKTAEVLNLERWTPSFLLDAIKVRNTTVDSATRRKYQYQVLWDGLKPPSRFRRCVLLFGGVSTALSDDEAFQAYATWLVENYDAELFIAYQSGASASARAAMLDPASIAVDAGDSLPKDPVLRMTVKEARVRDFCERLKNFLSMRHPGVQERFQYSALTQPLTTYVIIADDELFVTPLMAGRAGETLSFALARRALQFPRDVLNYVIYTLRREAPSHFTERALAYLFDLVSREYTPE